MPLSRRPTKLGKNGKGPVYDVEINKPPIQDMER